LGAGFNQEPSTHTEHPYCIENNPSSDVAQIHQNKFTGLDVSPKSKLSEEDHLPPTKIIDKKEAVLNNYISDFF
jgi:hypothetical protein